MAEVKTKGRKRIFDNQILEALTRTHPAIIIGIYIPLSIISLWYYYTHFSVNSWQLIGYFFGGFVFWTFAEYMLHRFLFHFEHDSNWGKKMHYLLHGIHHEYPNDRERLVMPPLPSVILATFFFSLYFMVMGIHSFAFTPGFVIGYLGYAMTHYAIHALKPPKRFKYIWKHHSLHHYKHPDKAFGVSSPIWDYVFGTLPPEVKKN